MSKKASPVKKTQQEKDRALLLKPCKTRDQLKAWIKYFLNLELPDVNVSRYSDTNPLDVIWEVYDICVNKNNPNNIQDLLFVAGRGSGKTLGMAIAELMILFHDQRDVVHVGAIQSQAERCYAYQKNFLYNRKLKPLVMPPDIPESQRILEKANMSKSIFNIKGEQATIEVLPCTLKACLVSSSLIEKKNGKCVEAHLVDAGDLIKSPQGWTKVLENKKIIKKCIRVELDDGRVVEGTLDHKVWTNKGWVELQNLSDEHEIV